METPDHSSLRRTPPFVRAKNGEWFSISAAPNFMLHHHVRLDPLNRLHFFLPITISFPNRPTIKTFAFVDSGSCGSHIGDVFSKRHSLPRAAKPIPVPIFTIDDRPLVSGLLTHDVIAQLKVRDHAETIRLGIVSMPYPVLLGLDWLKQHNPAIDWTRGQLALSCCGANHNFPISAFGKGYSLASPSVSDHIKIASLGLGLRLNNPPPISKYSLPDQLPFQPPKSETFASGIFANYSATPSVLRPVIPNGPSRQELKAIWLSPLTPPLPVYGPPNKPVDISHVSPSRFLKYSKNQQCYCIWYTPNQDLNIRINALSTHSLPPDNAPSTQPPPEPPPISIPPDDVTDPDEDVRKLVPSKYHDYIDVFSPIEVKKLPKHRPNDINIEIEEGKQPPFGPIYSLSLEERKALNDYIQEHLAKGFIRPSTSSASSPILFIKRKTGDLRLCVDYRGLNAITKKNRYPLPLTHDLIDRVAGCTKFTVIDLKNAYNLLRVKEGDEWKTAFRTHLGLYEYTVMPFGLTNAPATFQAFIQETLHDILDISCVVYLDDILIFSKPEQNHDELVKQVLERLRTSNLFANAKKCEFDKSHVEYLGYIISAQGIQMNPKKLATVTDWPLPKTIKQVQSFLGFTNFYRKFIHHYSEIALPLHALTTKAIQHSFQGLTNLAKESFEQLKLAFTTAPVLQHFNPNLPSTIITDASDFAIASILLQPDKNNLLHPVAFHSRKLSPAEINYEIHDKELLSIVDCFRDMRSWLIGSSHPIKVISDHKNLEYFMSSKELNRRQARWSMFLSEYNFELDYAPGKKNPADFPSRRPDLSPKQGDDVLRYQNKPLLTHHHLHLLFPSKSLVQSPIPPPTSINSLSTFNLDNSELLNEFKESFRQDIEWRDALSKNDNSFSVQNDIVFHNNRLYVPQSLRTKILHLRHDSLLSGHPGRAGTYDLVQRDFSWPGMRRYIRSYVSSCEQCQRTKNATHKPYGLLQPLDIPDRPWHSISMDFIVKLPASHGYDSIWVICDRMTRAAHFIPTCETMDAPQLSRLFLDRIFRYHGFPQSIVSDRGSVFISSFFTNLMKLCGTKMKTSTAYHPQTDGLTERTNQTLETYLRAFCSYQQDDWVDYLALAEFSFNNSVNSSTQQTPFYANFGYHPTFDISISERTTNPSSTDLATRLDLIQAELRAELAHSNEYMSKYYDRRHLPHPSFKVGDYVWLLRRNIKTTRPSEKLDYRRLGPFKILDQRGQSSFLLKLPSTLSRLHPVFHASLLEPYINPNIIPDRINTPVNSNIEIPDETSHKISTIIDSRKVGHRYDYFVRWKNLPESENSWLPFSEISNTLFHILEQFHRRNPTRPHPPRFSFSITNTDSPSSFQDFSLNKTDPKNLPSRPISPPPQPYLRDYQPPVQQKTRSGRLIHPPASKDYATSILKKGVM